MDPGWVLEMCHVEPTCLPGTLPQEMEETRPDASWPWVASPVGCPGVWQCPWAIQVGVSRWVQRLVVGPTDLLLMCSHSPTVKTWEPRGCFEV